MEVKMNEASMRHSLRNALLTLAYTHPAAVAVALRRGPGAAKAYLAEMYRCSKTDAGLHLPIAKPEELAPGVNQFTVTRPSDWDGSMTITEISTLCLIVAARRPKKILEVGTFRGLTTLNLALNAPEATVHTLDLPTDADPASTAYDTADASIIKRRGYYYYAGRSEAARIKQHHGDTASFNYSSIGGDIDICLIDAAHSYDYVRNDTEKVLPFMAESGLLLWHDYGRNDFLASREDEWGVSRFLHELRDIGVRILQGTSIGVLAVDHEAKSKLLARLAR
jgi:predicted O-methyltransferase YrrM